MERITVPKGHRCPLCPGHQDEEDEFTWCYLLNAPICWGCSYEIYYGLVDWDERPTSEQYSHAKTIEQMEQLTGQSFQQLKFLYIKEIIEEQTGATPVFLDGVAIENMHESELRILNEKLDYELVKLRLVKDAESFNPKWKDKFEIEVPKLIAKPKPENQI